MKLGGNLDAVWASRGGLVDPSVTLASLDVIFLNPFSPTGLVL